MSPSTSRPFRLKYCGIRHLDDLEYAIQSGADAIGINFFPPSPRYCELDQAKALVERANGRCKVVAVVVNPLPSYLKALCDQLKFDCIQFHGDEDPTSFAPLALPPILKAIPWRNEQDEVIANLWRSTLGSNLAAFLVDAYDPELRGGSGKVARWDLLHPRPVALAGLPMILAGGLTPHNVAQAIQQTEPDGIDVASGIEDAPGSKSPPRMQAFASAMAFFP